MNTINLKQVFGGISIMFAMMFMLIIAGNWKDVNQATTSLSKDLDTTLVKPLNPSGEHQNPAVPVNVVPGSFNPSTPADVVYASEQDPETKLHYKAIRSDKLKDQTIKPVLKLQVTRNQAQTWINADWSWIDYDQGILYFLYMTEQNGIRNLQDTYTGSYQLLL